MKVKLGSYTGDGTASRGITGIGFQPDVVIVASAGSSWREIRFGGMTATGSYNMAGSANATNGILSLDADGFTVGNYDGTNTGGTFYMYLAIQADAGSLCRVGSYVGNGVAGKAVAVGLQPDFVLIRMQGIAGNAQSVWATSAAPAGVTKRNGGYADYTDAIASLTATGFTLGTNSAVNANALTYFYLAVKNCAGAACGRYTGDGSDNRDLTGLGFRPDSVVTKATGVARSAWKHKVQATATTTWDGYPQGDGIIRSFLADGFRLGISGDSNANGVIYDWWALKEGTFTPTTEKTASDSGAGTEASTREVLLVEKTAADAAAGAEQAITDHYDALVAASDSDSLDTEAAGYWKETWLERPVYDPSTGRWHYRWVPVWVWYPGVQATLGPLLDSAAGVDSASVVTQLVHPAPDAGVSADALTGPPEVSLELAQAGVGVDSAATCYNVSLADGNTGTAQESLAFEIVPLVANDTGALVGEAFGLVALAPGSPEVAASAETVSDVAVTLPVRSDAGSAAELAHKITLLDRHILSCEIDSSLEALADGATLEMVETDPANPTSPVARAWLQLNRGDLVRIRLGLAGRGLDDYGIFRIDQVNLSSSGNTLRSTLSVRDKAALLLDEQGSGYAVSFGVQATPSTTLTPTISPSADAVLQQTQQAYPDMAGIAAALAARVGLGLIWDAPSYSLKDFTIGPEESTGAALGRLLEPLRVSGRYRTDAWVDGKNLVVRARGRGPIAGTLDCHLGQVQSIRRSQMPLVGTITVLGATVTQRIEHTSESEKKHADTPSATVEVNEEPSGDKVVKTYVSTATDAYSWDAIKELATIETTHQEYEEVPADDARWLGRVLVHESVQLDYDLNTGHPKHELREVRYSYDSEQRLILMTQLRKSYESPLWKLAELRTTHYDQATPTDVRATICEWAIKESTGELQMRAGYPKSQVSPGTLQSGLQLVSNPEEGWDQNEDGSTPRQTRTSEITKQYEGSAYGGGSLPRTYAHGSLMSDAACAEIASSIAGESGAWRYEIALHWPRPLPYRKGDRVDLTHLPGSMPDGDALLTRVRTRYDAERSEWVHDLTLEAWRSS